MFASRRTRVLLAGIAIWLVATLVLRTLGQRLLHPGRVAETLVLYLLSFVAFALLIRLLAFDFESASLLALPTLFFDSFSSLFFAQIFPNIAPAASGLFGGLMLICCAGAVVGAWRAR